jgi:hypothetical protein
MPSRSAILVCCLLSASCDALLGIEDTQAVRRNGVEQEGDRDASADAAPAIDGSPDASKPPENPATDASPRSDEGRGMDGGGPDSVRSDSGMDAGRDAGDASTSDEDGGPDEDGGFDDPCGHDRPLASGIALWLDAAEGLVIDGEGHVEQWTDRTRHGHRAVPVGDRGDWPVFVPHASGDRPAVQFGKAEGGTSVRRLQVPDHPALWFGSDAFALIAVLRYRNGTPAAADWMQVGAIYLKLCHCPDVNFLGAALFANDEWDAILSLGSRLVRSSFTFQLLARTDYLARAATTATGFNDNQIHVLVASRSDGRLRVHVDGELHADGLARDPIDVSNPGVPITIGANHAEDIQVLDGEVFELIALAGEAAGDAADTAECLMAKYAVH